MTYENAARAGKTEHGKIELRKKNGPKYSILVRPGYAVKLNEPILANRAYYRSKGLYRGFVQGAAYRRVRSHKTLGIHPKQIWAKVRALQAVRG